MSEPGPDDAQDLLAAELALGLLSGGELAEARRLQLSDPEFAARVSEWELRLAPLADEAVAVEPPGDGWSRIARLLPMREAGGDEIVRLRERVTLWRRLAGGAGAIAASLALFLATRDAAPRPVPAPEGAPVLVASVASSETGASLSVAYDGSDRTLLVTPGVLQGAAGHEHELWVIPAGGKPVSLGIVRAGSPQRHSVPVALAPHFRNRSTIAVSVEPVGGSRTGQPTGPVIAAGELSSI